MPRRGEATDRGDRMHARRSLRLLLAALMAAAVSAQERGAQQRMVGMLVKRDWPPRTSVPTPIPTCNTLLKSPSTFPIAPSFQPSLLPQPTSLVSLLLYLLLPSLNSSIPSCLPKTNSQRRLPDAAVTIDLYEVLGPDAYAKGVIWQVGGDSACACRGGQRVREWGQRVREWGVREGAGREGTAACGCVGVRVCGRAGAGAGRVPAYGPTG